MRACLRSVARNNSTDSETKTFIDSQLHAITNSVMQVPNKLCLRSKRGQGEWKQITHLVTSCYDWWVSSVSPADFQFQTGLHMSCIWSLYLEQERKNIMAWLSEEVIPGSDGRTWSGESDFPWAHQTSFSKIRPSEVSHRGCRNRLSQTLIRKTRCKSEYSYAP